MKHLRLPTHSKVIRFVIFFKVNLCFLSVLHWTKETVVFFPEIGQVKIFYHSPVRLIECVSEYTFLISKNNKQIKEEKKK